MTTFGAILLIASWIVCIWIGRNTGRNSGYNLGYNRGYHQCAKDYNIEDVSVLDYYQDREFEKKTGIYEAREFENQLKGKRKIK